MARQKRRRIVRVGMVKAESHWGDVKRNLRLLEDLCAGLAGERLDILVTPECFLDGYMVRLRERCTHRKLAARAVSGYGDPVVRRIRRLACELNSYVVVGLSEKQSSGTIRNAAYLLDRAGCPIGAYYKVQPGDFYEPGDSLPVYPTDFGTVGIVICADRRWPENIRCLRLKGAELILNPTWGMWGEHNTALMRTRAYENGIPICFAHPNQSLICSAQGKVDAVLESSKAAVLVHDIDLSRNAVRKRTKDAAGSAPIQNRRPELYEAIVQTR
ncbi:MAG: carbon-nitrogen hydrolase family protein [Kiritimatiellae bacterium]|nr:carbon-nitrogen hydrolase family protein [Kiritimatiellia bacterium]